MAASRSAGSARTANTPRDRVAEALYEWCSKHHQIGHVFSQQDLLASNLIPSDDLKILVAAVQNLVGKSLFRTHDIKGSGGSIGWELISQERAENYLGLTREEHLVFSHIDAAGNNGIWSRQLQKRLQAHAKVLEKTYHSLLQKGRIKKMTSVKNPNRKMFIVAGLQPSEDATGGAWFDEGKLDQQLIDGVSLWAEKFISDRSWMAIKQSGNDVLRNHVDVKGKGKSLSAQVDDDQPRSISPEVNRKSKPKQPPKSYTAHLPGYQQYPTATDVTNGVNASHLTSGIRLPLTAVVQLLEVMVYDGKLYKIIRAPLRSDEPGRDPETDQVTMYRSYKTPAQLDENFAIFDKLSSPSASTRKAARRQIELEDIGQGGASEVPCLRCPAFDLCGDGGPVNVVTCPYFDEWYLRTARADRDEGQAWPESEEFLKAGERKKQHRLEALTRAAHGSKLDSNAMDTS